MAEPTTDERLEALAERLARLSERLAVVDDRVKGLDAQVEALLTDLRREFELLDRQRANPNETAAGRALLQRIGYAEQNAVGTSRSVEALEKWRHDLFSQVAATMRTIRILATLLVAIPPIVASILGIVWTLHQLGVIR